MQFFKLYKILIIFIALFAIGAIGVVSSSTKNNNSEGTFFHKTVKVGLNLLPDERVDNEGCTGTGPVMFGTSPMKLEDIGIVLPYGLMVGGHVTPIDHMYFSPVIFNSPRDKYEVRAMADGMITSISERTQQVGDMNNGATKPAEYQIKFWYTCDFASYYDLITSLSPRLKEEFEKHRRGGGYASSLNIQVKEGEVVGRIGGQTLDFAVYDYTKMLPGFIVPKHYLAESWKLHIVNPFLYFKEPVSSELLALNPRQVNPREGKIDYDIYGKLVGTWFKEGNNGFGSTGGKNATPWRAHLSFVYDSIDPSALVISIGDYDGEAKQFGVKGNSPDPATIDLNSLQHKYELTQLDYYRTSNGQMWNRKTAYTDIKTRSRTNVQGVALVQMLENRKIKFEVFSGKTAKEVVGFTNKAIIYER
ncbi:MAG: hypothetical protein EXS50_00480 [Candidatus Taylorbacteria bacterium]|nr:hypothetical protein [Candidatus Taylorbacteria bacterium]